MGGRVMTAPAEIEHPTTKGGKRSMRKNRAHTNPEVDKLAKLRERLERREDRAQVRADARLRKTARLSGQRLARLRQRALLAGERARVQHTVAQSAEARALRVERTRALALLVLLPVLAAFGAWSASGVQSGMVKLLGLAEDSAAAHLAWLVEPALLGTVAGIILIRARLRSAGGDLDERATWVEFGALSVSILLNMAGHWPQTMNGAGLAALAGHALGPVGAAATAFLISVVQDGVSSAKPWMLDDHREAPSLKDLDDTAAAASESTPEGGGKGASERPAAPPVTVWPVTAGTRRLLPITAPESTGKSAPGSASPSTKSSVPDQHEQQDPEAPRKPPPHDAQRSTRKHSRAGRADKGARVPASARKSASKGTPRTQTDEELAARLAALVAAGEVDASASVRTVQSVLGVGWERAKRIHARTAPAAPARLRAVPVPADQPGNQPSQEPVIEPAMAAAVATGGESR
ncbi:hypothetical protein ACFY4C_24005 [Actinomadura viridis]|uniref:hypothetical protein n=1 Tax=Actinomadura viridis TaxID=58110 RepID=UPI0036C23FF7